MGILINNGLWVGVQKGSKLNLEPEIITYLTGLSTPLSGGQVGRLNKFVCDLKAGLSISALSDAFDVMYILANETAESGLRNLVKNAHHAEAVNSPTFTALEGFTGNGTSSYIDTKYNPATQGINYTLNNAGRYLYHLNTTNNSGFADGNAIGDSEATLRNMLRILTPSLLNRINAQASISLSWSPSGSGFKSIRRLDANNIALTKNYTVSSRTQSSVEISSSNQFIFRAGIYYSNDQISFYGVGRSLSDLEHSTLVNAIEAYMDSNGKGVIS